MLNKSCSTISESLQHVYDSVNRDVGPVNCGFDAALRLMVCIGATRKGEAVGKEVAQVLVDECEYNRDFDCPVGEAIGVMRTVALEQLVGPHFAQVVAQLVERLARGRHAEAHQDCVMELRGAPAAHRCRPSRGQAALTISIA